jgi:hypothetical protein
LPQASNELTVQNLFNFLELGSGTFSINDTQRNNNLWHHTECRYAGPLGLTFCLFIVMQNAIMLSVVIISAIMLSVVMLSVIMLSAVLLNVILQSVIIIRNYIKSKTSL